MSIFFNIILNAIYKCNKFSDVFSKKKLKFVSSRGSGPVMFDQGYMLLQAEVDLILEKQSYKKDT